MSLRYGYADTPLGQLHYAEAGTGEPMILVHQTPRSLDEFREVQPLLAVERRVIAMDMYGFGMSAKFPAPQRIEDYAAGVIALADALGLRRFAILGHHTGYFVASEVASAVPERITAAIMSAGEWVDEEFREAAANMDPSDPAYGVDDAPAQEDGSHLMALWAKRYPLYPKGHPEILHRFIRDALTEGVDPTEGHRACATYEMEKRVGLVTAPVLIIAATADPVSYPHTDRLREVYTNAKSVAVVEIEDGMIPLMEQKAPEVAAAVGSFLARINL
ncbi:alpha/beta hydrolase [Streptomyces marianii]|uniref:Alpha/beta hydrolase n=1 Tax=Streptomyces marianii TaxID=1817406 RepID=A0A5R9EID0_9ACTN|nr:alpha/beta hydrolase [Streptomyces marianii]